MKQYKCNVCGHEFNENEAAREDGRIKCPVCGAPFEMLAKMASEPLLSEEKAQGGNPVYISHMSFGALSREAIIALPTT